ncbi:MAG: DNA/RNA nuclease SfsA [Lentisphaeraceae bacterium]|nr:DNA/RNA nuclease SfsA [Lentisphaeraceae bacterium]
MNFDTELIPGKLIKRYKRFLADVELEDGSVVTAHCPNSGRMTECQGEGWKVLLSPANNPKRKLQYTWELVHNGVCWICVNTQRANEVAFEAVSKNQIPKLSSYENIEREKKYGKNSRIDILLSKPGELCYVEIKSVTLTHQGQYTFPDAPTERGRKHLDELMDMKKEGHRAVMLFIVMRSDAKGFKAADHIDSKYAEKLKEAQKAGVEVLVYNTSINEKSIIIGNREL